MRKYRISKYNPQYRVNGIYLRNEWTSIYDIGGLFADGVLTEADYKRTEKRYIECCLTLAKLLGKVEFNIEKQEVYEPGVTIPKVVSDESQLIQVIQLMLQEKCWAEISSERLKICTGYDYYIYIETDLEDKTVKDIVSNNNLFCD